VSYRLGKFLILSCIFTLVLPGNTIASQNSSDTERIISVDLKDGWMEYKEGQYNIISHPTRNRKLIHFFITAKLAQEGKLKIDLPAESSIFVDNKLKIYSPIDSSYFLDPSSLLGSKHEILVSISGLNLSSKNLETVIVNNSFKEIKKVKERSRSGFKDFFLFAFLIGAALTAFLRNTSQNISVEYFEVVRALNFRSREELIFKGKFFSTPNPLFYFVSSFLAALLAISLFSLSPTSFRPNLALPNLTFLQLLGYQFILTGVIYLWVLIKWLIIRYLSELFRLRNFSAIHFFSYERFSFLILLLINTLVISFFLIFGQETEIYQFIITVIILAAGFRVVLMFFKLLNESTYKSLHLFSYLCATEIIPYLIAIKLILI